MSKALIHFRGDHHGPHPVFVLWDQARREAVPRDQVPVVAVSGEWPGRLLILHERDLAEVAEQLREPEFAGA